MSTPSARHRVARGSLESRVDPAPTARRLRRRVRPLSTPVRVRLVAARVLTVPAVVAVAAAVVLFAERADERAVGAALLAGALLGAAAAALTGAAGARFRADLRDRVLELRLRLPAPRVVPDGEVAAVERAVVRDRVAAVARVTALVAGAAVLLRFDRWLGAAGIVLVLAVAVASTVAARRPRAPGEAAVPASPLLVQAYGQEEAEAERIRDEEAGAVAAEARTATRRIVLGALGVVAGAVGLLAVLGLAATRDLPAGALLGSVAALTGMLVAARAPRRPAAGGHLLALVEERPGIAERAVPVRLERVAGDLRFEEVTTGALDEVSLLVPAGQTVSVVGPDASALAPLVPRLVDPDAGTVVLDGHDLRELALADVRGAVAVVLQDALVTDGTVRDTVLWGRPGATEAELVDAVGAAGAAAAVAELPEGFDTPVGPLFGDELRQRLAIARALLRDAPVVVIEEPADPALAARLRPALELLAAGRTALVIVTGHRGVVESDRIVFLEEGRVTATGRHRNLLARSPGHAAFASALPGTDEPAEAFGTGAAGFAEGATAEIDLGFDEGAQAGRAHLGPDDEPAAAAVATPAAPPSDAAYPADPWSVTTVLVRVPAVGEPVAPPAEPVDGPEPQPAPHGSQALSRFALPDRPIAAPTQVLAAVVAEPSPDYGMPSGRHRAKIEGMGDTGGPQDSSDEHAGTGGGRAPSEPAGESSAHRPGPVLDPSGPVERGEGDR